MLHFGRYNVLIWASQSTCKTAININGGLRERPSKINRHIFGLKNIIYLI